MPHAHPRGFPPRVSGRPQHGEGQALALRGRGCSSTQKPSRYRSAGACPPRSHDLRENRTPANAVSLTIEAWRGTGPRPTVKGGVFYRRAGACRPRKNAPAYRSAGACPPRAFDPHENRTQAKAVFRSDRGTARDRPSPYVKGDGLDNRSAGACPPRTSGRPQHGEGQALALR